MIKAFMSNPTEFILNRFGYTMKKKPTLLGMHIVGFTHSSWLEDVRDQGRMSVYTLK